MTDANPADLDAIGVLRRTRDTLTLRAEIEEARARAANERLQMFGKSIWGLLGIILSAGWKRPWKLPKLFYLLARTRFAGPKRRRAFSEARRCFEDRRYEDALARCDEILRDNPADLPVLRFKREILGKMGDLSGMLATVRQARALGELESLRRSERVLESRLKELDPTWLPPIPGRPERYEAVPGRVLHLLKNSMPQHTSGYTARSRYTMLAQRGAGLDPVVVTSLGQPRLDGLTDFPLVEAVDGIEHHRLDLGDLPYLGLPPHEYLELFAWTAAEKVRALKPAVIHARSGFRGYEIPLVGLALSRHFGIPLVYEASMFLEGTWTDDVEWMERGELYRLRTEQENRCMREADHVVTIAESMKQEIVGRGIPSDHVTVIPNGVDPERFQPRPKDPELLRSLGLEDRVVLGYISNIGYREGLDIMVRGLAELISRGEDVGGLIVGDGPQLPALRELAEELGITDRVAITGPVSHEVVADYYAAIDLFVIPRRDERAARLVTPLKPYEAMALGKPLLVAGLPALLEVAEPPLRGAAFTPEDPISMADAATPLIRDHAERERLGEEARRWVLSERTWDRVGPMYRDVYARASEVAASRSTPVGDPAPAALGEAEALRVEIEQLGTRIAKARSRAAATEEKYWNDPMRKVRKGVREVLKASGPIGKLKQLVRVARRWRAARLETPDRFPPQRIVARKTQALPSLASEGSEGSLLELARTALATLPKGGDRPPGILLYAPLVRNNPFQALLYSACWESGIAPLPLTDLDVADEAKALPGLGVETWFHIHWTGQVLQGATSKSDAAERLKAFTERLEGLVHAGVRIAYTVHNALPHEHEFPALEAGVVKAILDRASLVHCLTEDAPDLVKPTIDLPSDKIEVIPHPSYIGVYPEHLSKLQARFELGLTDDDLVVATLGGIRAYKGIGPLLEAFEQAAEQEPRLRLIVAGKPIAFPEAKALRGRCEGDDRIISFFGRVPEDQLQRYAKAADAIVLAHDAVLNSGVLPLSLTFGRPVIAAKRGALERLVTSDIGITYDPDEPGGLKRALLQVKDLRDPNYEAAARKRAEEIAPDRIAASFAEALRRRY
ncbi:MAG: glycosyltransferase [Actinomycetota bacterium]